MKNIITTVLLTGLLATALIAGDGKKAACSAEASLKKAEAKVEGMACCPSKAKPAKVAEAKSCEKSCEKSGAEVAATAEKAKKMDAACTSCSAKKS